MPLVFVNLLQYTGTKGGIDTYAKELCKSIGQLGPDLDFVGFASRKLSEKDTSGLPER